MQQSLPPPDTPVLVDSGLMALSGVAAFYRIPADVAGLRHELALGAKLAGEDDLVRAAALLGLQARVVRPASLARLAAMPTPALARTVDGNFVVLGGVDAKGECRTVDPVTRLDRTRPLDAVVTELAGPIVLVQRRVFGPGQDPATFSMRWFLPSIWRYRGPIASVLLASLFVQLFALVTPLFFQVVIDKVLVHRSPSTLYVLVFGLVAIAVFDALLQWLRSYALNHTTNRIDVELGQRLFSHLLRLPVGYFETRPAGQTVARVRELETIRSFLTGQGLFAALDLVFTTIFMAVLFAYSTMLALVVLATIPLYVLIASAVGPALRERVKERFSRGAASQQFLVETVVGAGTVKAAAVEPAMRLEWEERLAAYVRSSFDASVLASTGQGAVQFVSKLSLALLLLLGSEAVMRGDMTVCALVAFNMIAGQVSQPVLRLSQVWQELQQVRISVNRLGDILDTAPEPGNPAMAALPPPKGAVALRNVSFRYSPSGQDVLRGVTLSIRPGEVVGIVGPSGSGKSTLTKLVQRFYQPQEGQVLIDGMDLAHVDPGWLRRHVGVVLQENLLFNRTLHDNIALADPAMPRSRVIEAARLAGADTFIAQLPQGYDTVIEERGSNLSGGQRQRIALARALVTNPRILILDEATSALDYESERIIRANMRHIVRGRTVIMIAHRLTTVREADCIYGMVDGRVVEAGRHDDLVKKPGGLYARLWALQGAEGTA